MINNLVAMALMAGEIILPYYRNGTSKMVKHDGSPVTIADQSAEALITKKIQALYPDIPLVAEEAAAGGKIPVIGERFFLVDPLDGTKEFLNGSGEFTVNIALIEHGVPVTGVVYAPAIGKIYHGEQNEGAYCTTIDNGQTGTWRKIRTRPHSQHGLSVVASKSHMTTETEDYLKKFSVTRMVSIGSSLKFCIIAEGNADLYPRLGRTMEWDTAAADAILRAAGGSVRCLDGKNLLYGKQNQANDADFANPWFVASGH